jgi:hypothetical protein
MINMLLLFSLGDLWSWMVSKSCYFLLLLDIRIPFGCKNCLLCNGWVIDYPVFYADEMLLVPCTLTVLRHPLCWLCSPFSLLGIVT